MLSLPNICDRGVDSVMMLISTSRIEKEMVRKRKGREINLLGLTVSEKATVLMPLNKQQHQCIIHNADRVLKSMLSIYF